MSRDKYHCPVCGKLKRIEGPVTMALGDKVNFTITAVNGREVRAKAAKGTLVELQPLSAIVSCKGVLHQVKRDSVTPEDAPNPLTYAFSELCECPKETGEDTTAIETSDFPIEEA